LKTINDTYGHETGDRAIQAMASILKKCFRNTDICARLGGDEFAITAVNLSPTICKKNIQKVNEECEAWSNLKGNVHLSISLGYVEFNHDESDFEYLLNMADKKLYEEKKRKKDL
ncbi:MAG TPA: GGDEF domain-containing protein, partial [Treponemataceae bacterium]|nr:GGDEF domain-containing protein [Treponemataceae bacterium]